MKKKDKLYTYEDLKDAYEAGKIQMNAAWHNEEYTDYRKEVELTFKKWFDSRFNKKTNDVK